jgi:hypothetical protein
MNQAVIPGLEGEPAAHIPAPRQVEPAPDEFDWLTEESVIGGAAAFDRRLSQSSQSRRHSHRADGYMSDDDKCIILATPDAVKAVIAALQRELKTGWRY